MRRMVGWKDIFSVRSVAHRAQVRVAFRDHASKNLIAAASRLLKNAVRERNFSSR